MNDNIVLKVPLFDQFKDTRNKKWADKTCAICSLKMILAFKNRKHSKLQIMDLVNQGLSIGGYDNKFGWKHKALIELAKKYGARMSYRKKFFYTDSEKLKGAKIINKNIFKGRPVVVSVLNRKKNGGHVVVVNGLQKQGNKVSGYFILDPNHKNKNKYFLNTQDFIKVWRGGMIFLD